MGSAQTRYQRIVDRETFRKPLALSPLEERLDSFRSAYGESEVWSKWMDSLQMINGVIITAAFIGLGLTRDPINSSGDSAAPSASGDASSSQQLSVRLLEAQLVSGSFAFLFAFFGILASTAASRIITSINYMLDVEKNGDLTDPLLVKQHEADPNTQASVDLTKQLFKEKRQWQAFRNARMWTQGMRHAAQVFTGLAFISLTLTILLIVNQRLTPSATVSRIMDACFIASVLFGTWMIYIPNQVVMAGRTCSAGCFPCPGCHPYCCARVVSCCGKDHSICLPLAYDEDTENEIASFYATAPLKSPCGCCC